MTEVDPLLVGINRFAMPYIRECTRRLEADPNDPDAMFVRAAILGVLGEPESALATLESLSRVDPHYPGLWHLKARLHEDLGDERMRILCLQTAKREAAAWGG